MVSHRKWLNWKSHDQQTDVYYVSRGPNDLNILYTERKCVSVLIRLQLSFESWLCSTIQQTICSQSEAIIDNWKVTMNVIVIVTCNHFISIKF